jgi:hypothetical protein
MGANIQVLIIVGTIIYFATISYAFNIGKGTATFYKRPYERKSYMVIYWVSLYILIVIGFDNFKRVMVFSKLLYDYHISRMT